MSKKYTASQTKEILFQILSNAYANIDSLSKELKKLDSKGEGKFTEPDSDVDATAKARLYSNTILLLNSMVSPAHSISYQLFGKEQHKFIDSCIEQHAKWVELQKEAKS